MTPPNRVRALRRLAPLLLVAGGLLLAHNTSEGLPRDQEVRFVLGDGLEDVRSLSARYAAPGESAATGVELNFSEGAPREVSHTPSLPPGRYHVSVELRRLNGQKKQWLRSITVPAEGPLWLRFGPGEQP